MATVNSTSFTSIGSTPVGNGDYGLIFTANNTTKITQVDIFSAGATKARIVRASDDALLGTATFSGTTAVFGTPVDITASTNYYVYINAEGAGFNTAYGTASSDLPSNNTDINFLATGVTGNAVFKTPYNATPATPSFNGGNQLGITSITTDPGTAAPSLLMLMGVG